MRGGGVRGLFIRGEVVFWWGGGVRGYGNWHGNRWRGYVERSGRVHVVRGLRVEG